MKRIVSIFVLVSFITTGQIGVCPVYAQNFRLPAPGVMVHLSPEFKPPILKGIKVHPDNPFRFDFILDKGDSELSNDQLKNESSKLIKYFLASLTIPEKDLWVNLSPYEKDRIVPQSFGLTEMGRDLLAEDYMLKQITASLIYPEDEIGKKFWKRIYEEASKRYGTTNVPVNTFNKVWIVPEKAVVYENAKAGVAYVVESKLKVMLEKDYLALEKNSASPSAPRDDISTLGSQIMREIVIPELTKEVNEGKNFARLRQVYNSLILATWYKKKIKDSILEQVYADKKKVAGVNIDDPQETQKIYQRYLQAFKKGVYNYIKEDTDPVTQETTPRKYFSGGDDFTNVASSNILRVTTDGAMIGSGEEKTLQYIEIRLDQAMTNMDRGNPLVKKYPLNFYFVFNSHAGLPEAQQVIDVIDRLPSNHPMILFSESFLSLRQIVNSIDLAIEEKSNAQAGFYTKNNFNTMNKTLDELKKDKELFQNATAQALRDDMYIRERVESYVDFFRARDMRKSLEDLPAGLGSLFVKSPKKYKLKVKLEGISADSIVLEEASIRFRQQADRYLLQGNTDQFIESMEDFLEADKECSRLRDQLVMDQLHAIAMDPENEGASIVIWRGEYHYADIQDAILELSKEANSVHVYLQHDYVNYPHKASVIEQVKSSRSKNLGEGSTASVNEDQWKRVFIEGILRSPVSLSTKEKLSLAIRSNTGFYHYSLPQILSRLQGDDLDRFIKVIQNNPLGPHAKKLFLIAYILDQLKKFRVATAEELAVFFYPVDYIDKGKSVEINIALPQGNNFVFNFYKGVNSPDVAMSANFQISIGDNTRSYTQEEFREFGHDFASVLGKYKYYLRHLVSFKLESVSLMVKNINEIESLSRKYRFELSTKPWSEELANELFQGYASMLDRLKEVQNLENDLKIKQEDVASSKWALNWLVQLLTKFIDPEGKEFDFLPVSVKSVLTEELDEIHAVKHSRLERFIPDDLGEALFDIPQFNRVLDNLVKNSQEEFEHPKESQKKARDMLVINVRAWKNNGTIYIQYSDNGGIDPDFLKKEGLFEKNHTTKQSQGGTGTGLVSSARIIKEHGGAVTAENILGNNGEVEGARFIITLPALANGTTNGNGKLVHEGVDQAMSSSEWQGEANLILKNLFSTLQKRINTLIDTNDPNLFNELEKMIKEGAPRDGAWIIQILSDRLDRLRFLKIFLMGVNCQYRFVRLAAVRAAEKINDSRANAILMIAVKDSDTRISLEALRILEKLGREEDIPELLRIAGTLPQEEIFYIYDDHSTQVAYTKPSDEKNVTTVHLTLQKEQFLHNFIIEKIQEVVLAIKNRWIEMRRSKKIVMADVKDQVFVNFMEWLKENHLEDIVVFGGGVKDALIGGQLADFDITVAVPLTDEEHIQFLSTMSQVNRRVILYARERLNKLAQALGVPVEDFFDPTKKVYWHGREIQYSGPFEKEGPDGQPIYIKRTMVDSHTWSYLSSNTAPSILQMAVDVNGQLYGHVEAIDDLINNEIRMIGKLDSIKMGMVIRIVKLQYELGLQLTNDDEQSIRRVVRDYIDRRLYDNEPYLRDVVIRQLKSLANIVRDKPSSTNPWGELQKLGMGELIQDHLKIDPKEFFDFAMSTQNGAKKENGPGGIDLTSANMNLQTQNAGLEIKFHIDSAMLQQLQNALGFVPVIINMQPMTNLRQFLGLEAEIKHF